MILIDCLRANYLEKRRGRKNRIPPSILMKFVAAASLLFLSFLPTPQEEKQSGEGKSS